MPVLELGKVLKGALAVLHSAKGPTWMSGSGGTNQVCAFSWLCLGCDMESFGENNLAPGEI